MEYILLAALALIVVLGPSQTAEFLTDLTSPDQGRNLLFRVAGFLLLSAWLHFLPSLLLLIYMRNHSFFAPEVFGSDSPRAVVIGIYLAPTILIGSIFLCLRQLVIRIGAGSINATIVGISGYAGYDAYLYGTWRYGKESLFALVGIVSAVIAAYISLALRASISDQLRLWFFPFLMIASVSAAMLYFSEQLSGLVGRQLMAFGSGGGLGVVMEREGKFYKGRLLLSTTEAAYVHMHPFPDGLGDIQCVVRIPVSDSVMTTNIGRSPKGASESC